MNELPETLTINDTQYTASCTETPSGTWDYDKVVIVRSRDQGVMIGELVSIEGRQVELNRARQLWRWRGGETLPALAGGNINMDEYTRIDEASPGAVTFLEACGVIRCTPEAARKMDCKVWG